jgi:uncharacterized membrane protein (DUF2068 family)
MPKSQNRAGQRGQAGAEQGNPSTMRVIAVFKMVDGLLLLAVALGALRLLNRNAAHEITRWMEILRTVPHNDFIHSVISKLTRLDSQKIKAISAGSFFYSLLLLTEGIGLWLRKRWAEYLTVIATGSLIPLELYELQVIPKPF